jgi:hypothetical protein
MVPSLISPTVVSGQYFGGWLLVEALRDGPIRFSMGHLTAVIVSRRDRVPAVDSVPTTSDAAGGVVETGRETPLSFSGTTLSCDGMPLTCGRYTPAYPGRHTRRIRAVRFSAHNDPHRLHRKQPVISVPVPVVGVPLILGTGILARSGLSDEGKPFLDGSDAERVSIGVS